MTGRGWQGNRIAYLNSNTQVYKCKREQPIEFGFSSVVWVQIAFLDSNQWKYGWILQGNIKPWGMLNDIELYPNPSLIAVAMAVEQGSNNWTLGEPPPAPASQSVSNLAPTGDNTSSASLSEQLKLYGPLFVAMLIGMIAKGMVDWLDTSDSAVLKMHLRNACVALFVSPIVFLGFLSAGQFSTSNQTFLVLCLLAFQNGFFWQTVLKRNVSSVKLNTALKAVDDREL